MTSASNSQFSIRRLAELSEAIADALAAILVDCVEGGASVGFMQPLTIESAKAYWLSQKDDVASGGRVILVAEDQSGIVGTVQIVPAFFENQPHRADIAKMLVHARARRQGIGAALIRAAEDHALEIGRWLLVLDTVTGSDADRLYRRLGWQPAGIVPDYALMPDGPLTSTCFFYRNLRETSA